MNDIIDPQAAQAAVAKAAEGAGWLLGLLRACPGWVAGIGPKAISERIAAHQVRLGAAEAAATYLKAEAQSIADLRGELRKRAALERDLVERSRLRHELELTERDGRVLEVIQLAASQAAPRLAAPLASVQHDGDVEGQRVEIGEPWLDRFQNLAQLQQEPWRKTLLAKALRTESDQPGSIGLRTLWTIGTMDDVHFRAFEVVGAAAVRLGTSQTVFVENILLERNLAGALADAQHSLAAAILQCGDAGLMQESLRHLGPNETLTVSHGDQAKDFRASGPLRIRGFSSTYVGTQLASLCDFSSSDLGKMNYQHIDATLVSQGAQRV